MTHKMSIYTGSWYKTLLHGAVGNMHLLMLAISTMGDHPWLPLLQYFACSFYGRALLLVHAFDADGFCF